AGWPQVPDVLAGYSRHWPDPSEDPAAGSSGPSGSATGDLGVLTAFVPQAEDGFELACAYARTGRDLTPLAADLGACVAQLHTHLRAALPSPGRGRDGDALAEKLRNNARWAMQ